MPGLGALWDSLVDCICRPPRDEYAFPDELVGGRRGLFRVGRYPGVREDSVLVNKRGMRLQCSHYLPRHVRGRDGRLPCVLYCHCNSGSRRDAEEAICILIPQGVSVFTLDFAGSGLSEGQWVTLGAEEVEDVAAAVEALRAGGRVSTLGLWGRSMGAVTALLYSQRDPTIAGMVLDSPFSRLTDLMLEIVAEQRLPIPRPLARLALSAMKRSVMKRAGFDINKVAPIESVPGAFIPALFGHATGDSFIRIRHSEALHAAYSGDKNLIRFEGDHNSRRPEFFYNSVSIFWHNTLQLESLLEPVDLPLASPHPNPNPSHGPGRMLRPPAAVAGRTALMGSDRVAAHAAGLSTSDPRVGGAGYGLAAGILAGTGSEGEGPDDEAEPGDAMPQRSHTTGHPPTHGSAAAAAAAGGNVRQEGAGAASERSATRAPWEPLDVGDLDRTEHERQQFRRMAGGLPSPQTAGPHSGLSYLLAGGGGPLGGGAVPGGANDDAAAAALAAALLADEALSGGGGALNGGGGTLHLSGEEAEEDAQLRAALELSLLEAAAAARKGAGGAGEAGGGGKAAAGRAEGSTQPARPSRLPPMSAGTSFQPAGPANGSGTPQPPTAAAAVPEALPPPSGVPAATSVATPLPTRLAAGGSGPEPSHGTLQAAMGAGTEPGAEAASRTSHMAGGGPALAPAAAGPTHGSHVRGGGGPGVNGGTRHGHGGGRPPSLYELYSEDELLALAVQLSLQEAQSQQAQGQSQGREAAAQGGTG